MRGSEFARWINPVLKVLSQLGGSARPREVIELVGRNERVVDEVHRVTARNGGHLPDHAMGYMRWLNTWPTSDRKSAMLAENRSRFLADVPRDW